MGRIGDFLRNKTTSNYIYLNKIVLTYNNNEEESILISDFLYNKKDEDSYLKLLVKK